MNSKIYITLLAGLMLVPGAADAKKRRARAPKVSAEQLLQQARDAFYDYNPELAAAKIDEAREAKNVDEDEADRLEARVNRMNDMIQRVEDIVIVDSTEVDIDDFLSVYRLSAPAGSLATAESLDSRFEAAEPTAVYTTEDGSTMLWGTPDGLAESHRMTDGSWEQAAELGDVLNAGGTANYPFLLSDGITLYYATDGDDSLGGLDIYISRRNRDGFAVPQNLGMPYNSPYNDYMLAIDEYTGAGWFATDRNNPGESVTVYTFIPAQSRTNLDVNRHDLAARARITDIKATHRPDEDYSEILAKIKTATSDDEAIDDTPDFTFAFPDGRVYTRWDQFKSDRARQHMENYVDALADFESDKEQLQKLREAYAKGNRRNNAAIIALEKKQQSGRKTLLKLANLVVQAEK